MPIVTPRSDGEHSPSGDEGEALTTIGNGSTTTAKTSIVDSTADDTRGASRKVVLKTTKLRSELSTKKLQRTIVESENTLSVEFHEDKDESNDHDDAVVIKPPQVFNSVELDVVRKKHKKHKEGKKRKHSKGDPVSPGRKDRRREKDRYRPEQNRDLSPDSHPEASTSHENPSQRRADDGWKAWKGTLSRQPSERERVQQEKELRQRLELRRLEDQDKRTYPSPSKTYGASYVDRRRDKPQGPRQRQDWDRDYHYPEGTTAGYHQSRGVYHREQSEHSYLRQQHRSRERRRSRSPYRQEQGRWLPSIDQHGRQQSRPSSFSGKPYVGDSFETGNFPGGRFPRSRGGDGDSHDRMDRHSSSRGRENGGQSITHSGGSPDQSSQISREQDSRATMDQTGGEHAMERSPTYSSSPGTETHSTKSSVVSSLEPSSLESEDSSASDENSDENEEEGKNIKKKRKRHVSERHAQPARSKFESSPEPEPDYEEHDNEPRKTPQEVEVKEEKADASERKDPSTPEVEVKVDPFAHLPIYFPGIQGCRSIDEFQNLNRIEEGTYGVVYRAMEKRTGEIVALKRLKMEKEKEGFPITSLREISTLLKAPHDNVVNVKEIVVGANMDRIYIVMSYVEHDLKSLMETMRDPFAIGEVKCLMQQLLKGVQHLHDNWILHRDLKTSNLLLSHEGVLKIGDFGLAREYGSPLKAYTSVVVTLWYRAPELLLGIKEYSTMIDCWSVGCVLGELLNKKPLFPGKGDVDQLNKIFTDLGTPVDSEDSWPGYDKLPLVAKGAIFASHPHNQLRKRFAANLSACGFDLISSLLKCCPEKRSTCAEALKHDWFKEKPFPVARELFPTWPAKSEQSKLPKKNIAAQSPKPPSGGQMYAAMDVADEKLMREHGVAPREVQGGFNLKFDAKLANR